MSETDHGDGMDRRDLVRTGLAAGAVSGGAAARPAGTGGILDAGVHEQQQMMVAGKLTSHALTSQYLARIKTIDKAGPRLNAIIEINPEALKIALEMDRERNLKRVRGPLHGIPVLLKDNIATADRMRTSAGSLALAGTRAARDAHVAAQLRAAGAVIIGKTNLGEWAHMRSPHAVGGRSARGGLAPNPHAPDRGGSGAGSGAAIAAGLATLAVGTETDGSIVSPASICGVVGIKPTLGLVSRSGIIPIAHAQDTAGPMARSVADAALMLSAMTGVDPRDPATRDGAGRGGDYRAALDKGGLQGARIGVARNFFGYHAELDAVIEKALLDLESQGAVLVDAEVPNAGTYSASDTEVLLHAFKADLAAYLREYAPDAPVSNMAEIIADNRRYARAEGVEQVMRQHRLDALVAPTGGPAWLTDFIHGDQAGGGFSSPAAVAGCPHITVPAGYVRGLPVGLSFVGAAYSEAALIRMAYSYEQATLHRRAPQFPPSVSLAVR